MKRLAAVLLVLVLASAAAKADHQRVVYYDFADPDNIFAATYWGTDDHLLKGSDFVLDSGLDYIDNDPTLSSVLQGMIGIDNRQGTEERSGWVTFHIDNWDRDWAVKAIWWDSYYRASDIGLRADESITVPDGYTVGPGILPGMKQLASDYSVEPNPPWEELTYTLTVPAGEYLMINEVTILTDCIPEPASTLLTITGFGTALLALRRRRR